MKKLISFSLILSSLFAADFQVGAGVGAGNGYKFMNVRMQKYLTPQNTIRFQMDATTKIDGSNAKRALVGASQKLNINLNNINSYAFADAGYQVNNSKKNGFVADMGIGVSYNVSNNVDSFMEVSAIRDLTNHNNHYQVLAGVLYKFDSQMQEAELLPEYTKPQPQKQAKTYKPAAPVYAQNVTISQPEKKKVVVKKVAKIEPKEKIEKINVAQNNVIDIDKESTENKVVIAQNSVKNTPSFKFVMHFDKNSRYIHEEDMQHLIDFAEYLQSHPNVKAEIQGYTDNSGNEALNKLISEKKAKLVYNILIDLGVNKNQISYKGYGADSIKSKTEQANMVVAKLQA